MSFHFKNASECVCWLRRNNLSIDTVEDTVTHWTPYYIINVSGDDEFTIGVYDYEADVIREARKAYGHMSTKNMKKSNIEVRSYACNIEVNNPENFDYDLVEWKITIPGLSTKQVIAVKKLYEYRSVDFIIADSDWYWGYINIITARNGRTMIVYIDKDYEDDNVAIYTDSLEIIGGYELDYQLGNIF